MQRVLRVKVGDYIWRSSETAALPRLAHSRDTALTGAAIPRIGFVLARDSKLCSDGAYSKFVGVIYNHRIKLSSKLITARHRAFVRALRWTARRLFEEWITLMDNTRLICEPAIFHSVVWHNMYLFVLTVVISTTVYYFMANFSCFFLPIRRLIRCVYCVNTCLSTVISNTLLLLYICS